MLDRQIFSILLQPIKLDLHLSDTQMGFVTGGAFAIIYTIAGFPLSRAVDAGNRRSILAATLIVWSFMTMSCGLARNYFVLLFARMGVGIGEAGSLPATMSTIADQYPPQSRSGAVGLIYLCTMVGTATSLALGGYLESKIGWRPTLFVVGAPGLALALLFLFTTRDPKPLHREGPRERLLPALRGVWRVPTFRLLAVMSTLFVFFAGSIVGWAPTFLERVHRTPIREVGQALGIAMLFGAAGALAFGKLADYLAKRDFRYLVAILGIGPLFALPPLLFFLYGSGFLPVIGSYLLIQFFASAFLGPSYALAVSVAPKRSRAFAIAILALFQNLGGLALGPLVIGVLNDTLAPRFGQLAIRYSLSVIGIVLVAIALIGILMWRTVLADIAKVEAAA